MGAVELASMKVVSCRPERVNAGMTASFFGLLKAAYPNASKIHIILGQSGYHRSQWVKDAALEKNNEIH